MMIIMAVLCVMALAVAIPALIIAGRCEKDEERRTK